MIDKQESIEREAAQIAKSLHVKGYNNDEELVEELPDELRDRVKRILRGLERAEARNIEEAFEQARLKRKFSLRNI